MKQNIIIAVVFCLTLSFIIGWNYYNRTEYSGNSVYVSKVLVKNDD